MRGAERALRRLDGVRDVEAIVGNPRIRIVPARDRSVDLARLGPTLWSAGIRARRIAIVAEGAVEAPGRFRIRGWPDSYPLEGLAPDARPGRIRATVRVVDGQPRLKAVG